MFADAAFFATDASQCPSGWTFTGAGTRSAQCVPPAAAVATKSAVALAAPGVAGAVARLGLARGVTSSPVSTLPAFPVSATTTRTGLLPTVSPEVQAQARAQGSAAAAQASIFGLPWWVPLVGLGLVGALILASRRR
jgi:hypothetical protein